MTHPAEEARTHIMAALEACQADPALADSLEKLTENLAKAQGKLFPAAKLPANTPGSIDMMRKAMDYLAQALKVLQDLSGKSDAVGIAAAAIARALKMLHPTVQSAKEAATRASSAPPASSNSDGETMNVNVNTVLSMNTDHQFYSGFSEDIDEGGIFVATFEPKPIGAKVLVNFKLPSGRPITARGVVQFVREYNSMNQEVAPGMGVKFTDLMSEDKKAIKVYLEARAPMFYDE